MKCLNIAAAALTLAVAATAHAERLVSWKVQGHITSVDVAADPTYAALWAKFQPGQTYVATFLVDLDAQPGMWGDYSPVKGSKVEFKEAGLSFQMSFINGGIAMATDALDLGWGYASQGVQGGPGLAYSFGGFSTPGGQSMNSLEDCDDVIKGQGWSHVQPIHFGFVGGELMSLGTFVHATVDSLTSSSASVSGVPEADTVALVLAGLPLIRAARLRPGAPRSWRLGQ